MKLSTKARYGTRALLDIAVHMADGPVQVRRIAERQEVSDKYLWHLLDHLRTAGIVRSIRGSGGGFVLVRDPSEIGLSEVLQVLEGPIAIVDCLGLEECHRADGCAAQQIWALLNNALVEGLASITLADLMERRKVVNKRNGARAVRERASSD